MSFETFIAQRNIIDAKMIEASKELRSLKGNSSGMFGLTPDAIKALPEYKSAKAAYNKAFADLRKINSILLKNYKKEFDEYEKSERDKRRSKKT